MATLSRPRSPGNPGGPTPARPPSGPPLAPAELAARRYALLVDSGANRAGHKLLDAARGLLDLLDDFADSYNPADITRAMVRAGIDAGTAALAPDTFTHLVRDAAGLRWVLEQFIGATSYGVVQRPADMGPDPDGIDEPAGAGQEGGVR